MIEYNYQ